MNWLTLVFWNQPPQAFIYRGMNHNEISNRYEAWKQRLNHFRGEEEGMYVIYLKTAYEVFWQCCLEMYRNEQEEFL